MEGPAQEVFFPQVYTPGEDCQPDFTSLNKLRITIQGEAFPHLLYHFVLPYSKWETGTPCFSESFESLSEGLQKALWELGGVPRIHRSDRLTAAVNNYRHAEAFTRRYEALLSHYGLDGQKIQARHPHENGDVEQRHNRFKRALEQALLLRYSRDFDSRQEYEHFLRQLFRQLNSGRQERLAEELQKLQRLPARRLDDCRKARVRVGPSSTIRLYLETNEDLLRMAGIKQAEGVCDNVTKISVYRSLEHRLPWLLLGLVGGLLAAGIIGGFERTLQKTLSWLPLSQWWSTCQMQWELRWRLLSFGTWP